MVNKRNNRRRRLIQLTSALIYNANLIGFTQGRIYQGKSKGLCVPGLNCYSCPGAIGSCPLGTLQNAISNSIKKLPFYIVGTLLLFGLIFGRIICGFLCPFGFLQEMLHKIPVPKIPKGKITRTLSYTKYLILILFVIILPLYFTIMEHTPVPAFCKYICPAGTLEGGIPLVSMNPALQKTIGFLFSWKMGVLLLILISCTVLYRSFCRFLCPLGAIYSLFCKVALNGVMVEESKCSHCNRCIHTCKMDVKKVGDHECIQCGNCISECPDDAIHWKQLHKAQ